MEVGQPASRENETPLPGIDIIISKEGVTSMERNQGRRMSAEGCVHTLGEEEIGLVNGAPVRGAE